MNTRKLGSAVSIAVLGAIFLIGLAAFDGAASNRFLGEVYVLNPTSLHPQAFQLLAKGPASGKTEGVSASQPPAAGVTSTDKKKSEGVRSQAEKRLEQQRKDLTRNWGG